MKLNGIPEEVKVICIEDIREENPNKDSIILEYHADLHCGFPFLCFACFPVTVTKTINIKKDWQIIGVQHFMRIAKMDGVT